ncbi:MAG: Gfo/Idh/MocA family oxidoreductase [Oscillospiraceae bacterium]|nr:Gfo/Idh/MocA family oxidoreductase [Oscillospiraceae bacterium]
MNKFKAVIIGCGAIAPVHAAAIRASEHAMLYGVCDIIPERMEAISAGGGQPQGSPLRFPTLTAVLADPAVDAVHICTPHHLHRDMILACEQAGKAVVIEKPVAISLDELTSLQSLSVPAMTVLQNRYNSAIQRAKELIHSGEMGKVIGIRGSVYWMRDAAYYASGDWRGKWATEGGGVVINQAIHTLDLLDYLGGGARSIKGSMDTRALGDCIEVEDTAEATLYFDGGVRGHFFATNANHNNAPIEITISLEHGTLNYRGGKLFDGDWNLLESDKSSTGGESYWGASHRVVIGNFYASLAGKSATYPTLHGGLRATELALALYQSARSGERVEVVFA